MIVDGNYLFLTVLATMAVFSGNKFICTVVPILKFTLDYTGK